MKSEIVEELEKIVGPRWIITNKDDKLDYLVDETPSTVRPKPSDNVVVVKPANAEEISKIFPEEEELVWWEGLFQPKRAFFFL